MSKNNSQSPKHTFNQGVNYKLLFLFVLLAALASCAQAIYGEVRNAIDASLIINAGNEALRAYTKNQSFMNLIGSVMFCGFCFLLFRKKDTLCAAKKLLVGTYGALFVSSLLPFMTQFSEVSSLMKPLLQIIPIAAVLSSFILLNTSSDPRTALVGYPLFFLTQMISQTAIFSALNSFKTGDFQTTPFVFVVISTISLGAIILILKKIKLTSQTPLPLDRNRSWKTIFFLALISIVLLILNKIGLTEHKKAISQAFDGNILAYSQSWEAYSGAISSASLILTVLCGFSLYLIKWFKTALASGLIMFTTMLYVFLGMGQDPLAIHYASAVFTTFSTILFAILIQLALARLPLQTSARGNIALFILVPLVGSGAFTLVSNIDSAQIFYTLMTLMIILVAALIGVKKTMSIDNKKA